MVLGRGACSPCFRRFNILFEPGEEVLVIDGPFTDFKGMVEKVDYEKSKLHLTVNVFNRPTQVELEFSKVEKLN